MKTNCDARPTLVARRMAEKYSAEDVAAIFKAGVLLARKVSCFESALTEALPAAARVEVSKLIRAVL